MDRQELLNLHTAQEKADWALRYLAPLDLPARPARVIGLITGHGEQVTIPIPEAGGEIVEHHGNLWRVGLTAAAGLLHCSPNTFDAAVRWLMDRKLVWRKRTTRPFEYFADWTAIERLTPPPAPDPAEGWEIGPQQEGGDFQSRSTTFNDFQSAHVHEHEIHEIHVHELHAHVHGAPPANGKMPARPWANEGGVTDAELVDAVKQGRRDLLRHLWREAVAVFGKPDTRDNRLAFLAAAHHCATCRQINSPMAVLKARMKARAESIDTRGVRHASDDWAARLLKRPAPSERCEFTPALKSADVS